MRPNAIPGLNHTASAFGIHVVPSMPIGNPGPVINLLTASPPPMAPGSGGNQTPAATHGNGTRGNAPSPTPDLFLNRTFFPPRYSKAVDDPIASLAARRVPNMTDILVLHELDVFMDPAVRTIVSGLKAMTPDMRFSELLKHAKLVQDAGDDTQARAADPGFPVLHLGRTRDIRPFTLRMYWIFRTQLHPIVLPFRNYTAHGTDDQYVTELPGELYRRIRSEIQPLDSDRLWNALSQLPSHSEHNSGHLSYLMGIALRLETEQSITNQSSEVETAFDGLWEFFNRQRP